MADLTTAPTSDPVSEVVTASVAAKEKGVHPVSVYRAIKEGRLKAYRSGDTLLIQRRDLEQWAPVGHRPRTDRHGTQAAPPLVDDRAVEEEARRIQREKNEALIQLLRSWSEEGDEEEQRQAFEDLKRSFEEDPWTTRKLFP